MVEPLLKELASQRHGSAAGGDTARLGLYQAIIGMGRGEEEAETSTSTAFERQKGAILPALVKDCQEGSEDVQHLALELLGHLCAMASSCGAPAFQPNQASSLWGAVATVLDEEAPKRLSKVLALFAVSRHTMETHLVAPSIAQLAPGVARSMRHESTVVRQHSAKAIRRLLGSAPRAMALCASGFASVNPEEDTCWARCLLRLCFDDAVLVRAEALSAAERAVSLGCLRGNGGVSAWVLEALKDGSLERSTERLLFHDPESQSAGPPLPNATEHLAAEGSSIPPESSPSAKTPAKTTPRHATLQRVKQAIRAWAVYLSSADLTSLLETRADGKKKYMDTGTALILSLSGKFSDSRDGVRMQSIKAWGMFATSMMAQCSQDQATQGTTSSPALRLEQARKVANMFLTVLANRVAKDRGAVREAAMSAIAGLVASFPSPFFRHLWTCPSPPKNGKRKTQGLTEVLRAVAGGGSGEVIQHYCARILAALLPCSFCLGPAETHPSLRDARLDLAKEMSPLLSTLETLMVAFPAPVAEDAASMMDGAVEPLPSSSRDSEGSSAAAVRLEVLPTTGLIANAWCGLAFWATERAAAAAASAGKDGTSDSKDGGGKGKGKPAAAAAAAGHDQDGNDTSSSSAAPPKRQDGSAAAVEASRPLLVLLGWLLGGTAAEFSIAGDSQQAASKQDGAGSRSCSSAVDEGKNVGLTALRTNASSDKLASWKLALLGALIRVLSRQLALSRARARTARGDDDAHAEGKVRIAEPPGHTWLDTPVEVSSLYSGVPSSSSAGCSPTYLDCALEGDVIREAIRREWGKGRSEGGDKDEGGNATAGDPGGKHREEPPPSSQFPLWLVLFEGVLRSACGSGHPRARDMRGSSTSGNGGRGTPPAVQGTPDGTRGGRNSCHQSGSLLPRFVLTEALALSPRGWSTRVLASLSRGVLFGTEGDQSARLDDADEEAAAAGGGGSRSVLSVKRKREEEQDSALIVLGHAWRAEAFRILLGWKRCRLSPPNSSGGAVDMGCDDSLQRVVQMEERYGRSSMALDGVSSVSAAEARVPQQQQPPSDELRLDAANTLRFLLQRASSLFSHPPPGTTWDRSGGRGGGGAAAKVAGDGGDAGRGATTARNGQQHESLEEAVVAAATTTAQFSKCSVEGGTQEEDWLRGSRRSAVVKAAFGAETAKLWSELFEARRASHTHVAGFSRLLRALAKDCGRCALSAGETEESTLVGPGPSHGADREYSTGWGLVFSQTQPQQQQQPSSTRGHQVRDVDRRSEKGVIASGTQERKPAQAAACSVQRSSSNASLDRGQDQGGGDVLSRPPPFFALPVLNAAALALLTAAPKEADAKTRVRAWKAGLAMLAWTLTSTTASIVPQPLTRPPPSPPPPPSPRPPLTPTLLSSATEIGAEEEAIAIGETCRCLSVVRSSLAAAAAVIVSKGANRPSGTTFPLDGDTLAPVSRLLAVAVSHSYAATAAQDASPGKMSSRAGSSAVAAQTEATCAGMVAASSPVRSEIRSLVVGVLSAVTSFRPEVLAASPGLLSALCPMLEAVLEMPMSSDADSLQSSLLDTWNVTFGNLNLKLSSSSASGGRGGRMPLWKEAFRPSLLHHLSVLSQRAEVKLPSGILLQAPADGGVATTATATAVATEAAAEPSERRGLDLSGENKSAQELALALGDGVVGGVEEGERKAPLQSPVVGDLRAAAAGAAAGRPGRASPGPYGNSGVAGILPAAGARRSFLGRATSSSTPSGAVATTKKRSPSSTSRADSAGGGSSGKFVRVVGSGRGSAKKTPTRRAAVTTHTSLDGSQSMAPWEDGSQLPDTDPDSVPDLAVGEELLLPPPKNAPPPPPKGPSTPTTTSPASEHGTTTSTSTISPGGTATSPSKRSIEEAESETVDPNKTPMSPPTSLPPPPRTTTTTTGTPVAVKRGDAGLPSPPDNSSTASDRRVRPRTVPAVAGAGPGAGVESDRDYHACLDQGMGVGGGETPSGTRTAEETADDDDAAAPDNKGPVSEAECLHATMLAIAKSTTTSGGGVQEREGRKSNCPAETGSKDESEMMSGVMSEMTSSVQEAPNGQQGEGGGAGNGGGGGGGVGGVETLMREVRSLASRVEGARPVMTSAQLKEVGSLLQNLVQR